PAFPLLRHSGEPCRTVQVNSGTCPQSCCCLIAAVGHELRGQLRIRTISRPEPVMQPPVVVTEQVRGSEVQPCPGRRPEVAIDRGWNKRMREADDQPADVALPEQSRLNGTLKRKQRLVEPGELSGLVQGA